MIAWCPLASRTPAIAEVIKKFLHEEPPPPEQLKDIDHLDLTYMGLTKLKTVDFQGLEYVNIIDLTGNRLHSLPDGIFHGLDNLECVCFEHNYFLSARNRRDLKECRVRI